MKDGAVIHEESFLNGLRPDPFVTLSQWADQYRVLPKKSSAEPGPWRTSRTPYLKEIMDVLSPSCPVEQIKVMKGTQLGFTEVGNNWFGFIAHKGLGSILMVFPTIDLAKKHSKLKLGPTIENTPVLKALIGSDHARDPDNTMLMKDYEAGSVILIGAKSESGLRSLSVRNLFLDEIDGYETLIEGDPVGLVENRTDAFPNRKIFKISTPTIKGASRIEQEFEDSDQRYYHVPCPMCGEFQVLKWSQIEFTHKEYHLSSEVLYKCLFCLKQFSEQYKGQMLNDGKWVAENPTHRFRGYHLSSLYSPPGWISWKKIVEEFLKARRIRDSALLKRFVNTRLAETWEEETERIEGHVLMNRREVYESEVPEGVCLITAGIDIQNDRIEAEIIGWGKEEESWSICYEIFVGNPEQNVVWENLDTFLQKTFIHHSGIALKISLAFIDTGANTKQAYEFIKPRQKRGIYGVKGSSQPMKEILGNPSTSGNLKRILLFPLGVSKAKEVIFSRLKIDSPGPRYMHFPNNYEAEYFKQLTGEELQTRYRHGFPIKEWKKVHERNEALDCRVYGFAAMLAFTSKRSIKKIDDEFRKKIEIYMKAAQNPRKETELEEEMPIPVQKKQPFISRHPGGFVKGWRR